MQAKHDIEKMENNTSEKKWDPLEGNEDELLVFAAKKRQIRNILKSYVSPYDVFSELIQNSMDAVDIRATKLNEPDYIKKIWIRVDIKNNVFSITDNGIGFNSSEFKAFLAPNISFKDGGQTRGHKGVGSTFIGFGFNYLQLGTKTEEYEFVAEIKDGRIWVDDSESIVTKPHVVESKIIHQQFANVDRGSTFTIKFLGGNIRPKSLTWFGANNVDQWLHLLLLKTPLGCIDFKDEQSSNITFDLEVIDASGLSTTAKDQNANYIYPHNKISTSVSLKELIETQNKFMQSGKPLSLFPAKFLRLNGFYEFFTTEEIKSLRSSKISEILDLVQKYEVSAYGYFCYSTEIWDELNDNVVKLRKGTRILRGGLQLSNNLMPQGELITIPLTSNIGYQNQAHIIVHFVNADPDLGRKGFQPELKELAESIAIAIVNKFKKFRNNLKMDTGSRPSIASSDDVYDWITKQVTYEASHPLKINNPHFFAPINEISITSLPQSEQDVIVLFNQLLAGGVIRGLKLLATDQKKQYDGVFKYFIKEPLDNHRFDKLKNPLGVAELENKSEYTSRPLILEYKYNLDALIREFENDEKSESEINLVIVWETGDMWKRNYEVVSLLNLENLHHREFHGLTHVFHSGHNKFQAIILSELLDYLNDFNKSQGQQIEKYSN